MNAIVDMTNGRGMGTYKFQYSLHGQVKRERFIPKDKNLAEPMLAWFFCQTLKGNFKRNIIEFKKCDDDSHKKPDVLMNEDGFWKGIQITQLVFTNYEERKNISLRLNESLARDISKEINPVLPVIVNIHPVAQKGEIPMKNANKKAKILSELKKVIVDNLKKTQALLNNDGRPIYINIDNPKLTPHFSRVVFNPIPIHATSRFPTVGNISVNYDQDDIAFNDDDISLSIDDVFRKKNEGQSEILLIWADNFGLNLDEPKIAAGIHNKFKESSFEEVYFLTFENLPFRIKETLTLWPLKQIKKYAQMPLR